MQKYLSTIQRAAIKSAYLVTLTYPGGAENNNITNFNNDLKNFFKRLQRLYPNVGAVWRMEIQTRGAPHYHLLIFGAPKLSKNWVAEHWNAIVAPGDEIHQRLQYVPEFVRNPVGMISYLLKPEIITSTEISGRRWGKTKMEAFGSIPLLEKMTEQRAARFMRVIRNYGRSVARKKGRFPSKKDVRQTTLSSMRRRTILRDGRKIVDIITQLLNAEYGL